MEILYSDEHLCVVDKPPGVLSQPDRTGDSDVTTLVKERLEASGEHDPFVGLVHRLDRPASGVMVLARTSAAARDLSTQFRKRLVEKRYVVLVEGRLDGIGRWTDYIAKPDRQPKIVSAEADGAKRAELRWQVMASTDQRSVLQVDLQTGRPHQIRLQASERRHPIVGDRRYGAASDFVAGTIALHHAVLRVDHPEHGRRETFVSSPPAIWDDYLTPAMEDAIGRMLEHQQPD